MEPILNGVQKPADVIARGSHIYDEATRKYKEVPYVPSEHEYPRVMFHATEGEIFAQSREHELKLAEEGWRRNAYPAKVAKDTVTTPPADLALIVLAQQQQLQAMQDKLAKLSEPSTTPIVAEEVKRGPGRPPKVEAGA